MVATGTLIGRYRIDAKLGQGGAGDVYRAFDTKLSRPVALKVLRDPDRDGEADDRLLKEARAAARIRHPNVIAIHDVGETEDGTQYLAMELIEGVSLRKKVGDAKIRRTSRIRWLVEIARGLHAAHADGVVHRDVKPENVIISADDHAKVLDFGIAKRVKKTDSDAPPPSLVTDDGFVRGTPRYMAPEQVLGEPLDSRTDQFSWGLLAYELLSGTHPLAGATGQGVLTTTIPPLREVAPDVSPEIERIVMRTLLRRRDGRFASMKEVADALENANATLTSEKLAPTVAEKEEPKRPPFVPIALAAVLVLSVGALFLRSKNNTQRTEPPAASATSSVARALVDLPKPNGKAEAVVTYVAAMQAFRDGALTEARLHLERTIELDPALAAAYLRLAALSGDDRPTDARSWYKKAAELRSFLDARESAVHEALAPWLADPPDAPATEKSIEDALGRYPEDPELLYYLGRTKLHRRDAKGAIATAERALKVDPKFGAALYLIATAYEDDQKQQEAIDRCLAAVPHASSCYLVQLSLDRERADCKRLEADARRLVAASPDIWQGYEALADALATNGAPDAAIRDASRQATRRFVPGQRESYEAIAEAHLALRAGDFTEAEKRLLVFKALKETSADRRERSHAGPALTLTALYEEIGQPKDAAKIADDFLERRASFALPSKRPESALIEDPVPRMLEARFRAGEIKRDELTAKLDAWTKEWNAKVPPRMRGAVWARGWAASVDTREDAREAILRLPEGRLPSTTPWAVGRALVLGERAKDALPILERAVKACTALSSAIQHTQAELDLGRAREATGDNAGACDAFQGVIARWGNAKPRSRTAEEAKAGRTRVCPQ